MSVHLTGFFFPPIRGGYGSVPQGHLTYLAPEVISKVDVDLSSGRILDTTVRTRKMDVYAYGLVN
jgi:hypothetical protein